MAKLLRNFYLRDTRTVAQELIGTYLVRRYGAEQLVCRITETEAYIGRCDKACHAYQYRRTHRTETLFAAPGTVYLYLVYGMHHCLNLVTEAEGEPAAVLIRGAHACCGVETISHLRFGKETSFLSSYQRKNFLNGPGKLCKGFGLTRAENGLDGTGDTLFVCQSLEDLGLQPEQGPIPNIIHTGKRIGIDYAEEAIDFPWRFYVTE